MAYYVLEYSYVPDILERRGPHREGHLALLRAAHERGEVPIAGAAGDPVDRAFIVWSVEDRASIEAFVQQDPYVAAGLVSAWTVHPWTVVIGG